MTHTLFYSSSKLLLMDASTWIFPVVAVAILFSCYRLLQPNLYTDLLFRSSPTSEGRRGGRSTSFKVGVTHNVTTAGTHFRLYYPASNRAGSTSPARVFVDGLAATVKGYLHVRRRTSTRCFVPHAPEEVLAPLPRSPDPSCTRSSYALSLAPLAGIR